MLVGAWARRRSVDFGPFFVYAALLFAFSALVSAVHVPGGTFIHSAVALAPHAYILALEGIAVGRRLGRRSPSNLGRAGPRPGRSPARRWSSRPSRPRSSDRAFVHGAWSASATDVRDRRSRRLDARRGIVDGSRHVDRRRRHRYWTGRGGVVLVNDPLETIEDGGPRLRHRLARPRSRATACRRSRRSSAMAAAPRLARRRRSSAEGDPVHRPCARLPGGGRLMTRREAVRCPRSADLPRGGVVRAYFAAQIVFPKPEDTAYYVGVARNLLEGRGLVSDALWSYQTPPLVFPRPAFEVWLPLPTFLAAIPMALLRRRRSPPRRCRASSSARSSRSWPGVSRSTWQRARPADRPGARRWRSGRA